VTDADVSQFSPFFIQMRQWDLFPGTEKIPTSIICDKWKK